MVSTKYFMLINSVLMTSLLGRYYFHHNTDKEVEAWRHLVTFPPLDSRERVIRMGQDPELG